ncbi:TPA: AAA family ATPase [Pseudomonas aeruginosa]|uniref:AAA family ATPase n=3 Tax=Pseudomonas aeruginosa TaxID=287 RepID=UPI0003B97CA7|nr:AAA family ATPase [Pseudomonas aeruginosa]ETU83567.1 hypothetical protein Q053_04571 [Pseudomonas aeruginosa BWHPSA048]ERU64964.1 hypothetical protein Q087_04532 [Pseudomonas aeruginosa C40]MBG4362414.1 AAA family ATPase [Pseudomonas aeruginosa]MBG5233589.1 AAA family ATPase [Pseudomonas aeruginosa]MBH9255360.1 AAA family ATPase [Pseudomonas aeruginosa]
MQKLISFGVRQLRSFGANHQKIPIKPINILVGKNSCGKSTFLRTFPLLRQSVQANTKSPILWFGDLVDFGDFSTALHDGADTISFDFEMILDVESEEDLWEFSISDGDIFETGNRFNYPVNACVTISRNAPNQLVTKLTFEIYSSLIEIVYSGDNVENVTARSGDKEFEFPLKIIIEHGAFFPLELRGLRAIKGSNSTVRRFSIINNLNSVASTYLTEFLSGYHHASKREEKIREEVDALKFKPKMQILDQLQRRFAKERFFQKNLTDSGDHIAEVAFTLLLARSLPRLLRSADKLFKDFYEGVRYQAPLRAAGERFYRYQDLRIDEIDHTGSNLPMVINSLDKWRQQQLSTWISENFGFELNLKSNGLHYELLIKEAEDKKFHNISDMGFGYSQILPVIVSIWLEVVADIKTRKYAITKNKGPRIIVLEQPELHLHPALQYKFGLAIAKVLKSAKKQDLYFVIETHSKHLIDALGEAIRDQQIPEEIVNIALFEKSESGVTQTKISGFNSEGYLINWPIGFLSPEYDY